VTYDLTIERVFDAPPELVFDTIVDPAFADEIFNDQVEGWIIHRFEIDLRVGGVWTLEFGPRDGSGQNDVVTGVFKEIDRPRRIAYDVTMFIAEWGRTVQFQETMTFEDQDGKTLFTVVQGGFETEELRDAFQGGTPDWVDSVGRVVEARARDGR
jgi:uncharacterized protein YndB with AHSA1/START domain